MTVAYFVIAHDDAAQVATLLGTLDHPNAVACVLLDAASPRTFHRQVGESLRAMKHARTHMLRPQQIVWGGFSLGLAYLRGLRALLEFDASWRYFVPLSGRCLPTQPHEALDAFLRTREGTNFAECLDVRTEAPRHLDRLDRFHIPVVLPGLRTTVHTRISRAVPTWFSPHKGSAWTMLHRDFCEDAARSELSKRVVRHLRWSFVADELLIPSLLMSGTFASTVDHDTRRFIDFAHESPHPRVLTREDLPTLRSDRYFFARKFDRRVDGEVIDALVASLR